MTTYTLSDEMIAAVRKFAKDLCAEIETSYLVEYAKKTMEKTDSEVDDAFRAIGVDPTVVALESNELWDKLHATTASKSAPQNRAPTTRGDFKDAAQSWLDALKYGIRLPLGALISMSVEIEPVLDDSATSLTEWREVSVPLTSFVDKEILDRKLRWMGEPYVVIIMYQHDNSHVLRARAGVRSKQGKGRRPQTLLTHSTLLVSLNHENRRSEGMLTSETPIANLLLDRVTSIDNVDIVLRPTE